MSIITIPCIIQIQLIPNCPSQTKEYSFWILWQLTNRTPILMITKLIIIMHIYIGFLRICVTCREIFRTLLTQERFSNYLYIVYIITICILQSLRTWTDERSLEGLRLCIQNKICWNFCNVGTNIDLFVLSVISNEIGALIIRKYFILNK